MTEIPYSIDASIWEVYTERATRMSEEERIIESLLLEDGTTLVYVYADVDELVARASSREL